jgi:hypothetical protein
MSFTLTKADKKTKFTRDEIEEHTFMKNATKYNHYGSRTGLASAMDAPLISQNLENEARAFGMDYNKPSHDQGAYCFKLCKADGGDEANTSTTPLEFAGRLFYPNDKGVFRITDQAYLDRAEQAFKEQQEYLDAMTEKAMISDEMAKYLLGVDISPLKSGNSIGAQYDHLKQFNGTPDYIAVLDRSSIEFSSSLCKLRAFVKQHLPIIDKVTTKKEIKEAE